VYVYPYVIPIYCYKLQREPNYLKVLFLFKFTGNHRKDGGVVCIVTERKYFLLRYESTYRFTDRE